MAQTNSSHLRQHHIVKKLANDEKTTVIIPVILDPVEVQVALVAVPVEVRDIAVTVPVPPDGKSLLCA